MSDHLSFSRLFEPIWIGDLKIKNRIVMLPMGTAYATINGEVTPATIDYYAERAKGGVGLVTVGNISPDQPNALNQLVLSSEWFLMGHYELVEKVHAQDARIAAQLNHGGRQKYTEARTGEQLISSSPLATTLLGDVFPTPRAMTPGEIEEVTRKFALAAERAQKVGYDLVELHGAHGYLINQFISPFMNTRTDEFGGSLANRMRFPLKLIKAVRQAVGPEYPVGFRLSADEFLPSGVGLDESTTIARLLEDSGIAYLSVTGSVFETMPKMEDLMRYPEGWKEYLWEGIKKAVSLPVIAGGGLRNPDFCERIIAEGKADFIGLARPLIADPQWPLKAQEKRSEDIRRCISCNECLFGSGARRRGGGARRCAINAASGRERDFSKVNPSPEPKTVMVIGGGPAGMEAARIAACRGHKVTLYEKGPALGGQLSLAGRPKSKRKILWLIDYLAGQINKQGVKVEMNTEVTPDLVDRLKPEAVVIATGAEPLIPKIPGVEGQNVTTFREVLADRIKVEKERVVVIGGGMIGCELAEHLLEFGNKVTVVEQLAQVAADMEPLNRVGLMEALDDGAVKLLTGRRVVGIDDGGVRLVGVDTGFEERIEANRIVVAVGTKSVNGLVESLEAKVAELYCVGDCNRPRVIMEAIYEGSLAGRQI